MQPWNDSPEGDGSNAPTVRPVRGDDYETSGSGSTNPIWSGPGDDSADDSADDGEDEQLVRPFVITGGRTRHARVHLRVEALVVATDLHPSGKLQFEHAAIVELCQAPISVAEVGARLGVPLGVAQILVGDLADAGLVRVHEATSIATPALLLRMIDAVRAL